MRQCWSVILRVDWTNVNSNWPMMTSLAIRRISNDWYASSSTIIRNTSGKTRKENCRPWRRRAATNNEKKLPLSFVSSRFVNNLSFYENMNTITFVSTYGPHFRMNPLLSRKVYDVSIRSRWLLIAFSSLRLGSRLVWRPRMTVSDTMNSVISCIKPMIGIVCSNSINVVFR